MKQPSIKTRGITGIYLRTAVKDEYNLSINKQKKVVQTVVDKFNFQNITNYVDNGSNQNQNKLSRVSRNYHVGIQFIELCTENSIPVYTSDGVIQELLGGFVYDNDLK